ncbi:hypothetical protein TA3x_001820 [Tundrisphaera sp. TA3]|uniref:hypothetical protein n=1 Tax=Tundrisphaera sp. TA3 TaxID=3435775 RepID=UPI003EBB4F81
MGVPIVRLCASIDYRGPGVACFDPEKVIDRLRERFPGAVVDPTDQAEREVARIDAFVGEAPADDEAMRAVRRQVRGKARRNGPVYRFQIDDGQGGSIEGRSSRYTVEFWADQAIGDDLRGRIVDFLRSLGLGKVIVR